MINIKANHPTSIYWDEWNVLLGLLAKAYNAPWVVLIHGTQFLKFALNADTTWHSRGHLPGPFQSEHGIPLADLEAIFKHPFSTAILKSESSVFLNDAIPNPGNPFSCFNGVPILGAEHKLWGFLAVLDESRQDWSPSLQSMLNDVQGRIESQIRQLSKKQFKSYHSLESGVYFPKLARESSHSADPKRIDGREGTDRQINEELIGHLNDVMKLADVGVFEWNLSERSCKADPNTMSFFSTKEPEVPISLEGWLARVVPEDRSLVFQALQNLQDGYSDRFDFTVRILDVRSHIRTLRLVGHLIRRDSSEQSACVIGIVQNITERKRLERELQSTLERFDSAMRTAQLGTFEWDLVNRVWQSNESPVNEFGLSNTGTWYDGKQFLALIVEEDRPIVVAAIDAVLSGKKSNFEFICRAYTEKRSVEWLHVNGHVVERDKQGNATRVRGINHIVTSLKNAERTIEESNNKLALAMKTARMNMFEWKPDERLVRGCRDLLFPDEIHDPNEWYPENVFFDSACTETSESMLEFGRKAVAEKRSYIENVFYLDRPGGDRQWFRAFGFPVEYDPAGIPVRILGIAVDMTAQYVTEKALAKSERRLRNLLDSAPSVILHLDKDFNTTYVNRFCEQLFQFSKEELLGRSIFGSLVPEFDETGESLVDRLKQKMSDPANPQFDSVNMNRSKDGRIFWLSWSNLSVFDDQGNLQEILCIGNDITELKETQLAVDKGAEQLRNLVETADSPIVFLDGQLNITFANSYTEKLLGYEKGELLGRNALNTLVTELDENGHPQRGRFLATYLDKNVTKFRTINRNLRKDGSTVWGAWSRLINRDSRGNIIEVLCIGNDITNLKEIQSRFDLAVEQAGLGFWEYNIHLEETLLSDKWYLMRGLTPREETSSIRNIWEQTVHIDDFAQFITAIRTVATGQSPTFTVHYRTRHQSRGWIWIRSVGMVTRRDNRGMPIWITGFDQDWTQEIDHEQQLKKNQALLERTLDIGRMGYWTYDAATRSFSSFFNAVRNIVGHFKEEQETDFLENLENLLHPDDRAKALTYFTTEWDKEKQDVFRLLTRNGNYAYVNAFSIPDFDEDRNFLGRVGVFHDISEQKKSEEIIREREISLLSVLAVSRGGIWQFDPGSGEMEISNEIGEILQAGPIGRVKASTFIDQWIHPEDRTRFRDGMQKLLDGTGDFEMECRLIDHTGQIKHAKYNALAIKDSDGRIRKLIGIILDITQRVRRENEVKESEQRYRTLFEHSGDAVILLEEGAFVEVNRRTEELFETDDRSSLLGMNPWSFAPEYQPDGRLSKDKAMEIMAAAIDSPIPIQCEWKAKRFSGNEFDAILSFSQVLYAGHQLLLMVLRDTTDQKNAARMLENYRAYLSVLAEIRKMFYGRNEQDIIQTFLVSMSNHFGFSKVWYGELLGNHIRPTLHAGPSRQYIDLSEASLDPGSEISSEFPLCKAIRENRFCTIDALDRNPLFATWTDFVRQSGVRNIFATPLEVDGKSEGGIVFYSNEPKTFDPAMIDYIQNVIRELSRILSEKRFWEEQKLVLRLAKEKAEIAAKAKSRFLANMSHEIRTPMTAILGYTEIFNDRDVTKEGRREAAFVIRNNAEYLLQILNDILDFSKIDADKLKIELRDVDISQLLEEVGVLYANKAKEQNLHWSISNTSPIPERIHTDPIRLKQILLNLVSNALKFTQAGSVRILVSWENEADEVSQAGFLRIDIKDTGIGMSSSTIASIFSPFHQADASTTRRFGGTGLGLAISHRLVKMLGGKIHVQSEEGNGTTFSILLPQQIPEGVSRIESLKTNLLKKEFPGESSSHKIAPLPLKGFRLLLAEDGKDNQRLFHLILSKAGADTVLVENGLEAYNTAVRCWNENNPFDLILMDMQMPVMDGYTSVQNLRKIGYAFPVVALTAHAMQEEMKRCLDAGCDDFITKPILRDALIEAVLENIEKRTDLPFHSTIIDKP